MRKCESLFGILVGFRGLGRGVHRSLITLLERSNVLGPGLRITHATFDRIFFVEMGRRSQARRRTRFFKQCRTLIV